MDAIVAGIRRFQSDVHPVWRRFSQRLRLHAWVHRFEVGEVLEVDPGGGLRPLVGDPLPLRASG